MILHGSYESYFYHYCSVLVGGKVVSILIDSSWNKPVDKFVEKNKLCHDD